MKKKKVVTIGGGSGTFSLLSHLRDFPVSISAIVSTSDSGGSSRRLMDEFRNQLPLGDLRMSLVALAKNQGTWRSLFMHRFEKVTEDGNGVGGHSLGNLILKALQDMNDGDLLEAIQDAQRLLDTSGLVIPVSLAKTEIAVELKDKSKIIGETDIDTRGIHSATNLSPIESLFLEPKDAQACGVAEDAIRNADLILIGPGDLYTSVLPNFLFRRIRKALAETSGKKIYICNLMTKHGETDNYSVFDFVFQIEKYMESKLDMVIANDGHFPEHLLEKYRKENAFPVVIDDKIKSHRCNLVISHLTAERDNIARHDGNSLLEIIFRDENNS